MAEVKVDLPDPFGPAITASDGILLHRNGELSENFDMGLAWGSGPKSDLKFRSIWQLLHIAATIAHKYNGMTSGKGIVSCPKTGIYSSLRELLSKNLCGRHASIITQLRVGNGSGELHSKKRSAAGNGQGYSGFL